MAQLAFILMSILATLVSFWSMRYVGIIGGIWFEIDRDIGAVIMAHPIESLTHMVVAPRRAPSGSVAVFT